MTKKKGYHRYGRRKRSRHKPTQVSIPIVLTATAPLVRAVIDAAPTFQSGDVMGGVKSLMHNAMGNYTGYFPLDNHFEWNKLVEAYMPLGIAVVVHGMLGKRINPQIKRIPFVGKYIGV